MSSLKESETSILRLKEILCNKETMQAAVIRKWLQIDSEAFKKRIANGKKHMQDMNIISEIIVLYAEDKWSY